MINTCGKRDLGWFERIICWEVNGEEEDSALVRAVRLSKRKCTLISISTTQKFLM